MNDAILIIGYATNAHADKWKSSDTNTRAESLFRFLIFNNLYNSNIGNKRTIKNRIHEKVIDITICTES